MSEVRGDTVVLGLVLSLVAFLFLFFTITTVNLEGDDWRLLLPGVARLTHSAFAGLGLLVALAAYQKGRSGWWLYAIMAVLPLLQWFAVGLWFARTRRGPVDWGRWVL